MDKWDGKSKGSPLGYRIFIGLMKLSGPGFVYAVMGFVAFFYFIFSDKKGINYYFKEIQSQQGIKRYSSIFRTYKLFGQTLIDRIALMSGIWNHFTFDFDGEDYIRTIAAEGNGGVLVGAHIGNWEIAGHLLKRINKKVHVLMFDGENPAIKSITDDLKEENPVQFIYIKQDISHLLAIKEALENGDLIAMHGDRYMEDNQVIECDFMGKKAKFPLGPYSIALKFNAPLIYVTALKESKSHYYFNATPPFYTSKITKPKEKRLRMKELASEYVTYQEQQLKKAPHQWFNFYQFWNINQ
ncbi:MAG: hypothetical protein MI922_07735 [Bacteroidales bacterium]|nr:hypothetical protein [Bacteroidales bacterium]